jgi:hypothetical protein
MIVGRKIGIKMIFCFTGRDSQVAPALEQQAWEPVNFREKCDFTLLSLRFFR